MIEATRWESGSEFHWLPMSSDSMEPTLPEKALQYSCGRTALTALLQFGMMTQGWRRLWSPTYNCPDVINTILSTGIELVSYFDSPCDKVVLPISARKGDVIFVVNFFGLKAAGEYQKSLELGIPVIEDHSHDPWSQWAIHSEADYVLVSLRKTLPIPDGGAIWSNIGSSMPVEPGPETMIPLSYVAKTEAMLLKSIYLTGGHSSKQDYLNLFDTAKMALNRETTQPNLQIDGISQLSKKLLKTFPWREWRELRRTNYRYFLDKVDLSSDVCCLATDDPNATPFSLVLMFADPGQREKARQRLIAKSIYPAIIWPLNMTDCPWSDEKAVNISQRMLSIHCDGRYGQQDMDKIANAFSECIFG